MIPICFITSIFTLLFANAYVFLTRNYLKKSQGCRKLFPLTSSSSPAKAWLVFLKDKEHCYFDFVELVPLKWDSVLVLTQESNQRKSRLQNILGFMFFGMRTRYNSSSADWRTPQTVSLTSSHRSMPQNIHFNPKCSEAGFFD